MLASEKMKEGKIRTAPDADMLLLAWFDSESSSIGKETQ